jgi:hypothetical protein
MADTTTNSGLNRDEGGGQDKMEANGSSSEERQSAPNPSESSF